MYAERYNETIIKAGRGEWMALTLLMIPTLLVSIDSTVTYLALPAISSSLSPTGTQLLWITDIYTFVEGGFLIVMGALGDRVGSKKVLSVGCVMFGIASALAAFSPKAEMLIAARAVLGLSGAMILPSTLSLINSTFKDSGERSVAFIVYTSCYSAGTMLGPLVGGALLTYFSWQSVFLISLPFCVLFMACARIVPRRAVDATRTFDLVGALLFTSGILLTIYVVKTIALSPDMNATSVMLIGVALLLALLFIRREKERNQHLLDWRLFNNRQFTATLIVLFVALLTWAGLYLFISQYLQLVKEFGAFTSGVITFLPAGVTMAGCMLSSYIIVLMGKKKTISVSLVLMLVGTLLLVYSKESSDVVYLIGASVCISLSCGLIVSTGIDLAISAAPAEDAGSASGISESSMTFGAAFGVAALGSIGTVIYEHHVLEQLPEVFALKDGAKTLGDGLAFASNLSKDQSLVAIAVGRSAFMSGFSTSAIAASIAVAVALLLFVFFLRVDDGNRRPA